MAEDQPIDFDKEMVGTVAVPEADQLDLAALTAWFEANVDGLFTDFPDRAVDFLR